MPYKLNKTRMEDIILGCLKRMQNMAEAEIPDENNSGRYERKYTHAELVEESIGMAEQAAEDIMDTCCCDEDCNEDKGCIYNHDHAKHPEDCIVHN